MRNEILAKIKNVVNGTENIVTFNRDEHNILLYREHEAYPNRLVFRIEIPQTGAILDIDGQKYRNETSRVNAIYRRLHSILNV